MHKILWGVLAIALAGCNGTSTTGDVAGRSIWFDIHGNGCPYLTEGCTFIDPHGVNKIHWYNDPYHDAWAEPVWKNVFDPELGFFIWAYGYEGMNGVFYDFVTKRAVNEGFEEKGRDILSTIGQQEADVVKRAGKSWAAKYNLSEEVGIRVARATNDWNKIGKTRERTEADLAAFTKEAIGMNYQEIKSAVQEGNVSKINEMTNDAAENWGTSPEQIKAIVKTIYGTSL